jgi:RsiW-degrading membrane proteinase PrsW (M82 family)
MSKLQPLPPLTQPEQSRVRLLALFLAHCVGSYVTLAILIGYACHAGEPVDVVLRLLLAGIVAPLGILLVWLAVIGDVVDEGRFSLLVWAIATLPYAAMILLSYRPLRRTLAHRITRGEIRAT